MILVYNFMIKSNREISLRQTTIQQWYEFFEKLNIMMQDYTIDYEEYFNRQMVWCVNSWGLLTWSNFKWNIWLSGYCTEFTAYGNQNSTNRKMGNLETISWAYHDIYDCSTSNENQWRWYPRTVKKDDCWKIWSRQSFGQYAALFIDTKNFNDNHDNEDTWKLVNNNMSGAIVDSNNIQELYLISHDWKKRLFFRRKLVASSWDFAQYRIQMLRLRWFDAWQKHNFDQISEWSYDRQIDTWACDTSMWFVWNWISISWAYSEYYLPKDIDDCRIDLTYGNTNAYTRNISISPLNDPDLYRADANQQINPYVTLFVVNGVYLSNFTSRWSVGSSIMDFKFPLKTTINMKDFYKE